MDLSELKSDYLAGAIGKPDYIERMHVLHSRLFEYAQFIAGTDISKIEINDGAVVMTARRSGVKILCDREDRRIAPLEILNFDRYEEDEAAVVQAIVKDGDVVFDVGANIGWYSLNIAKKCPQARIFAFEPIPGTFDSLCRNIELNGAVNIVANQFALSNKDSEAVFYYHPSGAVNASAVNLSGDSGVREVRCRTTTIDQYAANASLDVDFIKCDVEGGEFFVFQGGLDTLQRSKPAVFTEMLRKWSAKFEYHPNQIIQLFSGLGYRCFTLRNGSLTEFFRMDEGTAETNFFFLHDRHAELICRFAANR